MDTTVTTVTTVTPQTKKEKKDVPSKKVKIAVPELVIEPKQVIKWIKDHPLFKWGGMCEEIGIARSNFSRTMAEADPKIKPVIVLKIVKIISKYGFNQG